MQAYKATQVNRFFAEFYTQFRKDATCSDFNENVYILKYFPAN